MSRAQTRRNFQFTKWHNINIESNHQQYEEDEVKPELEAFGLTSKQKDYNGFFSSVVSDDVYDYGRKRSDDFAKPHRYHEMETDNLLEMPKYNKEHQSENQNSTLARYRGQKANETDNMEEPIEKEKPNFEVSGVLAESQNSKNGIPLKFILPPDSSEPVDMWRLYEYKGEKELSIKHIHRRPCILFGRDRRLTDLTTTEYHPVCFMATDHISCSAQHALIQFRKVCDTRSNIMVVKPYLLDLESRNGTYLNNKRIEPKRYTELRSSDLIKFGESTREYVLLCM